MSVTPAYDESIPVLTEVVPAAAPVPADAGDAADIASAVAPAPVPADAAPGPSVDAAGDTQAAADDAPWRALEERLVARVLDRLQDRVELALEDQVRASMAPVLDHVVARLASELRAGLQQTVEDVVARAVAQELAHLRGA